MEAQHDTSARSTSLGYLLGIDLNHLTFGKLLVYEDLLSLPIWHGERTNFSASSSCCLNQKLAGRSLILTSSFKNVNNCNINRVAKLNFAPRFASWAISVFEYNAFGIGKSARIVDDIPVKR